MYEFVIDYMGAGALVTVTGIGDTIVQPKDAQAYVDLAIKQSMAGWYYPVVKDFAVALARELVCSHIEELIDTPLAEGDNASDDSELIY